MAFSGGTILALNARRLRLGKNAALSAVDPLIYGQRARHITPKQDREPNPLHPLAAEYSAAVEGYLRQTLTARLAERRQAAVERAMSVFMGEAAPHAWPIHAAQLEALGIPSRPPNRRGRASSMTSGAQRGVRRGGGLPMTRANQWLAFSGARSASAPDSSPA
jgi:hypothetical protein